MAVTATPAGLEYCSELMARQMGWAGMHAGQLDQLLIKPPRLSGSNLRRGTGHFVAGSFHLFQAVTINSAIGAMTRLDNLTTPAGVQGPVPLKFYSRTNGESTGRRPARTRSRKSSKAPTKAELLVRECLVRKNGIAQPEVPPSRALFLEKAIKRQYELRDLHEAKTVALKQAFAQDQERAPKEHYAKIENWRQALTEEAGIETSDDRAFARKLVQTFIAIH